MSDDAQPPRPPVEGVEYQPQPPQIDPAFMIFRQDLFTATPRIFVTHVIIAVNVAMFVLMVLTGPGALFDPSPRQMLHFGAGYGPLTTHGQPWRLFTEMFVHFGLIHIGMNMYVLWQGGPLVERLFGNFPYLVIYLLSGLVGSVLSLHFHPDSLSGGASGAVFGVYGALLGFLVVQRGTVPQAFLRSLSKSVGLFIVYNIAFGVALKQVDMYAHGGGLVGGFVLGAILSRRLVPHANLWRAIVVAVVGAGCMVYIFGHLRPIAFPGETDQSRSSHFSVNS
jgi:rhomboid protease GluP